MTHRFPIKEIARQAALGPATVDRVLNNRAHVSPQTRARVRAAIAELEGQEAQLSARGRRLFFDVVIEAPTRFSREVQAATEAILPQIGSAVCRPRFVMQEIMDAPEVIATLDRILKRGSHGVCLKARDTRAIRAAVDRLAKAGIPVVTLVTDIAAPARAAYVGLDNAGAGRTAAFLVAKAVGAQAGAVLATRSHERFLGEEERMDAFATRLATLAPDLRLVRVEGGSGLGVDTSRVLEPEMAALADLRAVYSMGGGNRSILSVLEDHGLRPDVFVAHDLDQGTRDLLAQGRLDFVLHHDLRHDMRQAFDQFLEHHNLVPPAGAVAVSTVDVVTPANIPPAVKRAGVPMR